MEMTNMQMTENMPVVTQPAPPEPKLPTLADVIGVDAGKQEQVQTTTENPPAQEPGWFQGRLQKERAKWDADHQAAMNAMQAQVNELREYRIGQEADKLVASGKIADREMAMDYLRSKEGIPAPTTPAATTPARDERGRFVSNPNTTAPTEIPADIQQRANELYAQAKTLQKVSGVDVLGVYRANPEYMERVNSGEWDMADVLKASQQTGAAPSLTAPAPVRSPNGNGIGSVNFRNMTAEQFNKVNEALSRGGKIDMR